MPIRVRTTKHMYVHECCVQFVFLERRARGIGKSPVFTENVGPSTLHLSVMPVHASLPTSVAGGTAVPVYSNCLTAEQYSSIWYVRVCMLLNREHIKAQQSTVAHRSLYKAVYNQVRADQTMYPKECVPICMLRPVCSPGARSS